MRDRRSEQRWPAYLGGMIVFDGNVSSVECLIRNTSTCGARLMVDSTILLPSEFLLQIPRRQSEQRVRMRWRQLDRVGIEAVSQEASAPIDLALMRQIKQLESHNRELERRIADLGDPDPQQ